ncbi:hypothetical protein H9P43_002182 [Blastocladiella emersonii ATCC 22665]|nr:hypothetical protein H9P43_002182 [Blastocladiella emersonii ATCC 22665]
MNQQQYHASATAPPVPPLPTGAPMARSAYARRGSEPYVSTDHPLLPMHGGGATRLATPNDHFPHSHSQSQQSGLYQNAGAASSSNPRLHSSVRMAPGAPGGSGKQKQQEDRSALAAMALADSDSDSDDEPTAGGNNAAAAAARRRRKMRRNDSQHLSSMKSTRTCEGLRRLFAIFPLGLQCLLKALFGDLIIFTLLGIPDLLFSSTEYVSSPRPISEWTSNINLGGMPLLLWSGYLMVSYTLHWAARYILLVLPALLERSLKLALRGSHRQRIENLMVLVRALHPRVSITVWCVVNNILWHALVARDVNLSSAVALPEDGLSVNGTRPATSSGASATSGLKDLSKYSWRWQREFISTHDAPTSTTRPWWWWDYISVAFLAVLLISIVWTAQRFITTLIVLHFHRTTYATRIKRLRFADAVVDRLMPALDRVQFGAGAGAAAGNDGRPRPRSMGVGPGASSAAAGGGGIAARARQLFARQAQWLGSTLLDPTAVRSMVRRLPQTTVAAQELARELFIALRPPQLQVPEDGRQRAIDVDDEGNPLSGGEDDYDDDSVTLGPESFAAYFDSQTDVRRAFRLFDKDGNGDCSRSELTAVLVDLVQELRAVEAGMDDTAKMVSSLDQLVKFVALVLSIWLTVTLFRISLDLSAVLTLLVPFSFIVKAQVQTIFECMLFLFAYRSFAVHDRIIVGGSVYLVQALNVFTTVLKRGDGKIVHYPLPQLSKEPIDNIRESGAMSEDLLLRIDWTTSRETVRKLESRMGEWIASECPRDFVLPASGIVDVRVNAIDLAKGLLECSITLPHRGNWQDMGKRLANRNKFVEALRAAILDLGIGSPAAPELVVPAIECRGGDGQLRELAEAHS